MIIFTKDEQVMAYYTHDTKSRVWIDQGFVRQKIASPDLISKIRRHGRNSKLVGGDVVSSLNSVQPVTSEKVSRLRELYQKLSLETINPIEIREMLRLERQE